MRVFATIETSGRGRRGRRGRRGIKIRSFVGRLVFVRSVVSSSFVRFRLTTDGCRVI
tara:strand:- start:298 stop:468 length:171 start_codon:yes stop_codon:yes gene_type:complete